jgi:hypothetical protein
MINIVKEQVERVCQGDIFSNVELIEYADINKDGIVEISKISFPYVVVLTQDCDLEQDFNSRLKTERANEDKHILSVIVAPLYNIEHVYGGEHLSELNFRMQTISSKPSKSDNKFLRNNQNPRYHFFEFPDDIQLVNSVADFKHYFTVNNNYLKSQKPANYVGKIAELYREQVSQRFASYLSRIGLPN